MASNVTAESVLRKIGDHLACPICSDSLREPKVLDCSHTFCLQCLQELRQHQTTSSTSLICPLCRHKTIFTEGNDIANQPSNYTLRALVEEVTKQEKLLEGQGSEIKCQSCDEKNPAISKCMDCDHFICHECQRAHERMAIIKSHRIYTLAQLRSREITCKLNIAELVTKVATSNIESSTAVNKTNMPQQKTGSMFAETKGNILQKANKEVPKIKEDEQTEMQKVKVFDLDRDKAFQTAHAIKSKEEILELEKKPIHNLSKLMVEQPEMVPDSFSSTEVEDLLGRLTMNQPEPQAKNLQSFKKWKLKTEIRDFGLPHSQQNFRLTGSVASFSNNQIVVDGENQLIAFSLPKGKSTSPLVPNILPIKSLTEPRSIAVNDHDDLVILHKHTVKIFYKQHKLAHQFLTSIGSKDEPRCLAVDDSNRIAVGYEKEISLHNPDGSLIRTLPAPMIDKYLAIYKQRLIYTNYARKRLLCMDYHGARVFSADIVNDMAEFRGLANWFKGPTGVCCDSDGSIYVAVFNHGQGPWFQEPYGDILHYSPDGKFIGYAIRGCDPPGGITLTPAGDLVVANRESVQIFHCITNN